MDSWSGSIASFLIWGGLFLLVGAVVAYPAFYASDYFIPLLVGGTVCVLAGLFMHVFTENGPGDSEDAKRFRS